MNATTSPWRLMRQTTNLTMNEVGRRAGISSGRMSIIERGVTPSDDEARRLREVLIQTAYDEGRTADGQDLNREAGIARGGSVESGGAVK